MASRYRHEDVEAVPKGWKVRTVKAGSHRVRVAFPPGRRVKGSGRLVSVLHPLSGSNPCANPCTLRSANPQELLVMGANPPRRSPYWQMFTPEEQRWLKRLGFGKHAARSEDDVRSMKESIRRLLETRQKYGINPAINRPGPRRVFFDSSIQKYTAHKFLTRYGNIVASGKSKAEAVRNLKAAIARAKTGQRNPNPAELLVMAANPRVEVVHSSNPPTEEIVEGFTGQDAEWLDVYNEPHMPRGRYAQLGPLIALYIKPAKGGQVQRIGAAEAVGHNFPQAWGGKPPIVVTDSSARQIYFVDGSQDLTDALSAFAGDHQGGLVTLGQARRIDYQCRKEHVAAPDEDLWKHEHGEENGVLPTVLFDTKNKRLLYEGGDYRIEGPWIKN